MPIYVNNFSCFGWKQILGVTLYATIPSRIVTRSAFMCTSSKREMLKPHSLHDEIWVLSCTAMHKFAEEEGEGEKRERGWIWSLWIFGIVSKTVLNISKGKAPPYPMFHTSRKLLNITLQLVKKDFVIHPHMTEKCQNKVDTLTSGHPVHTWIC